MKLFWWCLLLDFVLGWFFFWFGFFWLEDCLGIQNNTTKIGVVSLKYV